MLLVLLVMLPTSLAVLPISPLVLTVPPVVSPVAPELLEMPELLEVFMISLQIISTVPVVLKRSVLVPHPFTSLTETTESPNLFKKIIRSLRARRTDKLTTRSNTVNVC